MNVLTIAGSDSCSGAGIQADIKTACALGVYASCAVTCVTAQSPDAFYGFEALNPELVTLQIASCFEYARPDAIKIGMLARADVARAVGAFMARDKLRDIPIVVDPVLSATHGADMGGSELVEALRKTVIPYATLVTPNLFELERLSNYKTSATSLPDDLQYKVQALFDAGATNVLVKGGHAEGALCTDRLYGRQGQMRTYSAERLDGFYHGTGCTLSTAIACGLARKMLLCDAVTYGRNYLLRAMRRSIAFGTESLIIDHLDISNS